jgi:hypothetical protein
LLCKHGALSSNPSLTRIKSKSNPFSKDDDLLLLEALKRIIEFCQAPVAHTCNPSYSGGKDKGGSLFKATPRQIVHKTQSRKNSSQKRDGGVAQSVGPEFKPQ